MQPFQAVQQAASAVSPGGHQQAIDPIVVLGHEDRAVRQGDPPRYVTDTR